MARRRRDLIADPAPAPAERHPITRLRRLVLENISLDSPAYEQHRARLARANTPAARVAAYEQTLREAGVL